MRRTTILACSLAGFLLTLSAARATLVPRLDLEAMTSGADLIAVGRLVGAESLESKMVEIQGQPVQARVMLARLAVERTIKGQTTAPSVTFRFVLPDMFVGYPGIGGNEFGVFFLRAVASGLEVFDPYHPYLVASPGGPPSVGSYEDQVVAEVAHVLDSPNSTPDTRLRAVLVLEDTRVPLSTQALERAARGDDLRARVNAVGALLERKDLNALPEVKQLALSSHLAADSDLLTGLGPSLDSIEDPRAVPILTDLLAAPNAGIRRGAAVALRNTHAPSAIAPLSKALYDTNRDVQYFGVIGLAEITGTTGEWAPATDTFMEDPRKYVEHWRQWAKSQE
jgi:hypothetical protein